MEQKIRHRRLYAFYRSKALNMLMILIFLGLIAGALTGDELTLLFTAVAGALFIGYALWIWIVRPRRIVINDWLSNISGLFFIYFILFASLKEPDRWWGIAPILVFVPLLFILSLNAGDREFEIKPGR